MTNKQHLRQCFLELLDVFGTVCKENSINWHLAGGTLLGAVRDKGFIQWDDDADVSCMMSDIPKLLKAKWPTGFVFGKMSDDMYILSMLGTTCINVPDKRWLDLIKKCKGLCGIHIDIFPVIQEGKTAAYSLFKNKKMPSSCFGKGVQAKFEDREYPIPNDSVKVLTTMYGKGYLIPKNYGIDYHKFYVDFNNDESLYGKGILKLPTDSSYKHSAEGPMFFEEVAGKSVERPGVLRNLHGGASSIESINGLIGFTGLNDIKIIEIGAYAGEGTRIFAANDKVKEIYGVTTYKPWNEPRNGLSRSNLPAASEEMDKVVAEFPGKVHKFDGTLEEFHNANKDFVPDLVYIDARFHEIRENVKLAIKMGAKFIAGHDYGTGYWYEVDNCVNRMLGGPDKRFDDTSWIKDTRNIKNKKIALCVIGRHENQYALEYVEHYKNIGFDHIYVYDNNHYGEERFEDVLQEHIDSGFVTIVDFKRYDSKQAQISAYNDCLKCFGKKYGWIAFFDFDEFLTINSTKSLKELLNDYNDYDSVEVNWKVMTDSGLIFNDDRPLMERFTVPMGDDRKIQAFNENDHVKTIVRSSIPGVRFGSSPHFIDTDLKCCNGDGVPAPRTYHIPYTHKTMYLKHFTTKTLEEWLNGKMQYGAAGVSQEEAFRNYNSFFFKVNFRTPEKTWYICKWIEQNKDVKVQPGLLTPVDYYTWVSYHEDYLVWNAGLKEDDHNGLFPTHRPALLENVNYMSKVWCELVTMWYVWHNRLKSERVGFSHYRRRIRPSRLPGKGECAFYEANEYSSIYGQYLVHNIEDMDLAIEYIDAKYGKGNKYTKYLMEGHLFIQCNVFMMQWDDFMKLGDFLFPIIDYVSEKSGCGMDPGKWRDRVREKFNTEDDAVITYQTRAVGFLAERLVSAYIVNNMKYYR